MIGLNMFENKFCGIYYLSTTGSTFTYRIGSKTGLYVGFSSFCSLLQISLDYGMFEVSFGRWTDGFFIILPLSRKHLTINFPVDTFIPSSLAARLIEYPLLEAKLINFYLI